MLILAVHSSGVTTPLCSRTKEVYKPQIRLPSRDLAGSDSRPLTNIPHCCLPQEFGPCLSTNVGDLPLRTPRYRGLGGPLPRQLPNITHAHPSPIILSSPGDAPGGRMRYQSEFLPVIPLRRAGCIRVTHPCAGRRQKCCHSLAAPRLACVKPVASVHPEPGSNSPLLFISFFLFLCFVCQPKQIPTSRPRPMASLDGGLPPSSFVLYLVA